MWQLKKLGDVCNVTAGQSPEGKYYNYDKQGLPFYQGKKLFSDRILLAPNVWTSKITKLAMPDDVLISVRAPVGSINITKEKICIGRGLAAINSGDSINRDFLFYYLTSIEDSLTGSSGAVFNSINKSQIENIPIPLPPLPIQKQIVEKLDAAFADIDKAISATQKNIKNAEALFSKVLNQILENNLNKEFLLGELCELITKGITPTSVGYKFTNEGINFIKIESISTQEEFLPKKFGYINEECHKFLKRSQLISGDILFSIAGALGRTALVTEDIIPANTNQALAIIRLKKHLEINHKYLMYALNSNLVINQSDSLKAGVAQQNISLSQLKTYKIYLPDASLQDSIVKKIDIIKNQINILTKGYQNKVRQYESLKSSLLNQAFSNKLTKDTA